MNLLFIISSLIFVAFACKKPCPCESIRYHVNIDNNTLTEGPGCAFNLTCRTYDVYLKFSQAGFPVPSFPSNADGECRTEGGSDLVNLMDYFGVTCDNATWYATKFPAGIRCWPDGDYSSNVFIGAEELNGKGYKSTFYSMRCFDY